MEAKTTKLSYITENLDKILAIVVATGALTVALYIIIWQLPKGYRYIETPVLVFIVSVVYLLIRKYLPHSKISFPSELSAKLSTHLILNILFFGFFFYSLLSVLLRPELYSRPLGYFVSTAIITAILAIEILFLPKGKTYTGFILLKIALIALSLRWMIQLIFPEMVGVDPWWLREFTRDILASGYISEGTGYSNMPVMPLVTGSTMLITGLNYKFSAMLSIGFLQAASLLSVFLLGRFIWNSKVGLLAALLLGIASSNIDLGFWIRPITLGAIIMPLLIYTALKAKEERSVTLVSLTLLLSVTLILTHTIASMFMALLLFLFWFGFEIYKRFYRERFEVLIGLTLGLFFTVAMFSWWMYESGHIMTLAQLIERGFRYELWEHSALISSYLMGHELENLLNMLGFNLYLALSCLGLFYMSSRRLVNKRLFALSVSAWGLMAMVFFPPLMGRAGILPGRWYPGLEFIAAIPLAIGLLFLCEPFRNRVGKASMLAVLVLFLSFLSITRPNANIDNPIYSENTMVRFALTESEVKSADTITDIYHGSIKTDSYYMWPFYLEPSNIGTKKIDMSDNLASGDYSEIEGLIVIRKEIIDRVAHIRGAYKLDHDPREELTNLNFNRIYDSGSVSAFLKEE